jgi:beta-galactosidase
MNKQNFDLSWEYIETVLGGLGAEGPAWQVVNLPHDASIRKPLSPQAPTGPQGGYAWSGLVTYRKRFVVPEEWRGLSVQVEFEGVYMNAEVSINRQLVTLQPYGYTSFLVDLTPHLKYGQENTLQVGINNSHQPNSRWYSGMGIYRHVWLRTGGALHIRPWGVFITTPSARNSSATVKVVTELEGSSPGALLRSTLLDASGIAVGMVESAIKNEQVRQTLVVKNPSLWSVEFPYLYTLTSEVWLDGVLVDSERTLLGIRSISVDAEHGFRLNGAPLKMRGGCVHHDNGLLGTASYDRAEERKVELLKSAGFNAVRCAHNPPAPAFLDACDRLGLLVIDESFDCWRMGKNPGDYHLFFEDWWQRDTEAMVRRDRNHPSVVIWSIGNEVPERTGISDGVAWARRQAEFVRSLDPTRPVTAAMHFPYEDLIANPALAASLAQKTGSQDIHDMKRLVPEEPANDIFGNLTHDFNEVLDIAGYNYLFNRYEWDHGRFPERVIAGTETYPMKAYETWAATESLPYVIGDFVWTALDYLGESGLGKVVLDDTRPWYQTPTHWPYHLANCGDFDICGFKRPQSFYRDLLWGLRTQPFIAVLDPQLYGHELGLSPWSWEPVLDSWSFPGQEGKPSRVDVYAVDDEVELMVNGVSIGRQQVTRNKATFTVSYQPGTVEAIGYQNGKKVSCFNLGTAGAPAALRLTADLMKINHAIGDLAYVTIEVVDGEGRRVPYAELQVSVEVKGAGCLAALGTADPLSEETYTGPACKTWQGRLMAVVSSTGQPGEIELRAQGQGIEPAIIVLLTR